MVQSGLATLVLTAILVGTSVVLNIDTVGLIMVWLDPTELRSMYH